MFRSFINVGFGLWFYLYVGRKAFFQRRYCVVVEVVDLLGMIFNGFWLSFFVF